MPDDIDESTLYFAIVDLDKVGGTPTGMFRVVTPHENPRFERPDPETGCWVEDDAALSGSFYMGQVRAEPISVEEARALEKTFLATGREASPGAESEENQGAAASPSESPSAGEGAAKVGEPAEGGARSYSWTSRASLSMEPEGEVRFNRRGDPYGCFSNFASYPVLIEGATWPTTEHFYQAQKFASSAPELVAQILADESPLEAAKTGRKNKARVRADWVQAKDNVMRVAVMAKVLAHVQLQHVLLSTGRREIIEDTRRDSYWGNGPDGSGKNMLGKILMEVRALMHEHVEDAGNLQDLEQSPGVTSYLSQAARH